jgi:peptidoglycan lytic transglycosylase G
MMRILLALLLIAIIAAGAFEWERANFVLPGPKAPHGEETVVLVPAGVGLAGVSQELADDGVVARAELFQLGVRLRGNTSKLKAGEYAVPSRASMDDIMAILIAGKSIEHKFTAAEGLTSDMIFKLLMADPVLIGDAGSQAAEGTLLPETYLFTHGATRSEIVERMKTAQKSLLDRLWATKAGDLPLKNEDEAVILASIVEKETAIPEERRHVAAVFENRLRLGMKLQSDPTIIYAITKGYPLGRRILESEINAVTPYNTYVIPALPAGPICNPGKDAIAAVLNPAPSRDLYFVANGTGGHAFSATQAEQDKNVAIWRRIESKRR